MKIEKEKIFRYTLIIIDGLVTFYLWKFVYIFRNIFIRKVFPNTIFAKPLNSWEYYYLFLPIVVLTVIFINYYHKFYRHHHTNTFYLFINTIKSFFSILIFLLAFSAIFREFSIGRSIIFLFSFFYSVYLYFSRIIIRWIRIFLIKNGLLENKTIIVGTSEIAAETTELLKSIRDVNYKIIGYLKENNKIKDIKVSPILGSLNSLPAIVKKYKIEEIVFATENLSKEELLTAIVKFEHLGVPFKIVSNLFEVMTEQIKLGEVLDLPLIEIENSENSVIYDFLKRILDLSVAIPLFIISLPLWLIIAVAIKIDSRGPIIFKQKRVGKNGKIFTMYKFRTMYADVNPYEEAPFNENDSRITPVGKFLRKTSLDELPQLINVIKGDMSLVGPRPEMPFIVEKYTPWQRKRLEVKPGLTGLWQVVGRKRLPLHLNLEYDFYYIKHRSILFDLLILIKTIPAVIFGKGAY